MSDLTPDPKKWFEAQTILAFAIIATFLVLLFVWTFYQPDLTQAQKEIVDRLMGGLTLAVGMVLQFFLNRKE